MPPDRCLPGSFRDPDGFMFVDQGTLYRHVAHSYQASYDHLIGSGLYHGLVKAGHLIPHEEVDLPHLPPGQAYRIIRPEPIPFISYPYEWCFSQLKDAALLTLDIQRQALEAGMSLKDCSAYNVQFRHGKPLLIDTLSFERYREGSPWVAYRQFCQQFLAPLALMSYTDVRLSQLLRVHLDGIPLDLCSTLLPVRTYGVIPLLTHIHLQARTQRFFAGQQRRFPRGGYLTRRSLQLLIDHVGAAVAKLAWRPRKSEWSDYRAEAPYSSQAREHKEQLIAAWLDHIGPQTVWDIGANVGVLSRIASRRGIFTVAFDNDPVAVEQNYRNCVQEHEIHLLPLVLDVTNPSPGMGWGNQERLSWIERGPADMVLVLALIHHLVLSHNIPFHRLADGFSKISRMLIIEFIPAQDAMFQALASTRDGGVTDRYTLQQFEEAFGRYFTIRQAEPIRTSQRTLYLMERKSP